MPRVGLEPTIAAFEGAKTVHALDRAATVIGALEVPFTKFHRAVRIILASACRSVGVKTFKCIP
jgi:hypothetical protein